MSSSFTPAREQPTRGSPSDPRWDGEDEKGEMSEAELEEIGQLRPASAADAARYEAARTTLAAAAAVSLEAAASSARPRRGAAATASAKITAATLGEQLGERQGEKVNKPKSPPKPADSAKKSAVKRRGADDQSQVSEEDVPQPKRQRIQAQQNAAASAGAAAAGPPSHGGVRSECKACTTPYTAAELVDGFYCPCCLLIPTIPDDSVANRARAKRLEASPPPSSGGALSSIHTSQYDSSYNTAAPAKPKLGAYEAELKRLLDAGGDPPDRVQSEVSITHQDAIDGMRQNAYAGTSYQLQSVHLTNLIRSGHFKELTLALPVTNLEAQRRRTAEAKGGKVMLSNSGVLTSTADSMVERQLSSLQEFLKIVIVSILPSLFDRPRAALDWLELTRTVINIAEQPGDGWPVALAYLNNLLSDRVPRRQPFNTIDLNLLATERALVGVIMGAPRVGGPTGRGGAAAAGEWPAWKDACDPLCCRGWNLSGCKSPSGQCSYMHQCCWSACPTPADGHQGRDCAHRPPDAHFRPQRPPHGGGERKRGIGGVHREGKQ